MGGCWVPTSAVTGEPTPSVICATSVSFLSLARKPLDDFCPQISLTAAGSAPFSFVAGTPQPRRDGPCSGSRDGHGGRFGQLEGTVSGLTTLVPLGSDVEVSHVGLIVDVKQKFVQYRGRVDAVGGSVSALDIEAEQLCWKLRVQWESYTISERLKTRCREHIRNWTVFSTLTLV